MDDERKAASGLGSCGGDVFIIVSDLDRRSRDERSRWQAVPGVAPVVSCKAQAMHASRAALARPVFSAVPRVYLWTWRSIIAQLFVHSDGCEVRFAHRLCANGSCLCRARAIDRVSLGVSWAAGARRDRQTNVRTALPHPCSGAAGGAGAGPVQCCRLPRLVCARGLYVVLVRRMSVAEVATQTRDCLVYT